MEVPWNSIWFYRLECDVFSSGRVRSGSSGQSYLRENVPVVGRPLQQDTGDEEQEAVFHRCAGHRRVWNLPGSYWMTVQLLSKVPTNSSLFSFILELVFCVLRRDCVNSVVSASVVDPFHTLAESTTYVFTKFRKKNILIRGKDMPPKQNSKRAFQRRNSSIFNFDKRMSSFGDLPMYHRTKFQENHLTHGWILSWFSSLLTFKPLLPTAWRHSAVMHFIYR